jgi:beta propeller repeat protein
VSGRSCLLLLLLLVVAQPMLARPIGAAMPDYRVERAASLPVTGEAELALSGPLLLWQELTPTGLMRIQGLDLRTSRRLPLPVVAGNQRQPALASTLAAWIESGPDDDRPRVVVYDLDVQRQVVVSEPDAWPDRPAVDGTTVVWRERRGESWAIIGRDLVSDLALVIADTPISRGPPAIAGRHVVWEEFRDGSWEIAGYDLAERRALAVAGGPDDQVNPRIAAGRVVYEERPAGGGPSTLKVASLAGEPTLTIASGYLMTAPDISDSLVVWEDWRAGVSGVFAYDLDRRVEFPVTRSEQARRPVTDGLMVAWLNLGPFGTAATVSTLRPVLPSDRRDPPLKPDPSILYFPETGHTLGFGFKGFWQQHGGLAVFGYPLTEEFKEEERGTGRTRTVQYFERFLLEYDEREPEPDRQVKIARLGAEWLAGREGARQPPIEDTAERRYFPETGQVLRDAFKASWDEHDGLRLLGFPLTGEIEEAGRTVQYFERGRLEREPAPEGGRARVGPGLLGRDVLQARGWLPGGPAGRPAPSPPRR